MKNDNDLRRDVEHQLEWEPSVDERQIGVSVVDGVVTLTGEVKSYAEKWKAERTAEQVSGVKAIANRIEVHLSGQRSDTDVAEAAVHALKWNVMVPSEQIKVEVDKGWVKLVGIVNFDYQRRAAERAVRNLPGVRGISNLIVVRPKLEPDHMKQKIEETFKREALMDAHRIDVDVSGSEVTLRGTVRTWLERHEAEKAAWSAPGVTAVHNYVTVDPSLVAA
jgi:osmotically-inducible protein OsmY